MSTMEQALRDALADLLTEARYMAQQLAHRGLPGVPGDSVDRAIASAKAALTAALPAPGVVAPGDWVMVPREATEAMGRAGVRLLDHAFTVDEVRASYAAMLAAAPSAPASISQAQAQAMREALESIAAAGYGIEVGASDKEWERYWRLTTQRCRSIALAALTPEPPR